MERIILDHFGELFQTSNPTSVMIDEILQIVAHVVTPTMNQQLSSPSTSVEVTHALSQISSLKFPGPDGLPQKLSVFPLSP